MKLSYQLRKEIGSNYQTFISVLDYHVVYILKSSNTKKTLFVYFSSESVLLFYIFNPITWINLVFWHERLKRKFPKFPSMLLKLKCISLSFVWCIFISTPHFPCLHSNSLLTFQYNYSKSFLVVYYFDIVINQRIKQSAYYDNVIYMTVAMTA